MRMQCKIAIPTSTEPAMNVQGNQQVAALLKPCPERLVHRSQRPFGPGPTLLRRIETAVPQLSKHTVCQVATKLPADQVKHHPGAVTQLHLSIFRDALQCTSSHTGNFFWCRSVLSWTRPSNLGRVLAPKGAPPLVILPGFGNCSADYTAPFGLQQNSIAHFLQVILQA